MPELVAIVRAPREALRGMVDEGVAIGGGSSIKIFHQSFYAGCCIGFGGHAAAEDNPTRQALFPVNLLLILLTGGVLITGAAATVPAAVCEGKLHWKQVPRTFALAWTGNLLGAVLSAFFVEACNLNVGLTAKLAMKVAEKKIKENFVVTFLKGIGCNWLVCMAVFLQGQAQDMTGKMVGIWFPISCFVAIGFEHIPANMFMIPLGMIAGADVSVWDCLWRNFIPVTLRNIFAGSIFVGVGYSFALGKLGSSPMFNMPARELGEPAVPRQRRLPWQAMAVQKRKAVAKSAQDAFAAGPRKGAKRALEEAAAAPEGEPEEQRAAEAEEEPEVQEEVREEDRLAQQEEEVAGARRKELKAMAASDLKDLAVGKGLEAGSKGENVDAVLAVEARERAEQRAKEARLRLVVVRKKEELEALPFGELVERCKAIGLAGKLTKENRVQQLMAKWQQDDGISKGLAAMAVQEREAALHAMEISALVELCGRAQIDPLLKEVMVDRLLKHESASGRFARPEVHDDESMEGNVKEGKTDLVDALLADETNRKRQEELKRKAEEADSNRRKELQAKSVEDLKKLLAKKGQEATGKKHELVEALMTITSQEEALAARRAKLRALGLDELHKLLSERRVEAPKRKDAMIGAILEHDEKARRELEVHRARAEEVEAQKREEMCAARGLRLGRSGEERVAALLEAARAEGEIDKLVSSRLRDARREELLAMDKEALKTLCDAAGVDVLVKDVVVERILSHESEHGRVALDAEGGRPPAKKARSKK
ncbi:unnamed protein product [Prorocentrum cordatum]|uniref:SAP domain-containing protein n=1 Tax=Prorocentrum cordatum TaxID=2364126 RepID=A0ABN9Q7K8_9DINO|nr:unnamed protein product [Polarella glacialis]